MNLNQECWKQSKALVGIGESAKNYALLYNHYVRVDRWDKACEMRNMVEFLAYAIPFIDKDLQLNIMLDTDGELIKEITITCDGEVFGLPWKID